MQGLYTMRAVMRRRSGRVFQSWMFAGSEPRLRGRNSCDCTNPGMLMVTLRLGVCIDTWARANIGLQVHRGD